MKNAFTLAEILLTLIIIGVIAALTVPSMKKVSEENSYASSAKKAYSVLTSVIKQIKAEEGPVKMWDLDDAESIANLIKSKFNVSEDSSVAYDIQYLNGQSAQEELAPMFESTVSFYTVDGMLWSINSVTPACELSTSDYTNSCINVVVDINGQNPPNTVGVDVFGYYVTSRHILPYGSAGLDDIQEGQDAVTTASCAKDGTGWGCSSMILTTGKISW